MSAAIFFYKHLRIHVACQNKNNHFALLPSKLFINKLEIKRVVLNTTVFIKSIDHIQKRFILVRNIDPSASITKEVGF